MRALIIALLILVLIAVIGQKQRETFAGDAAVTAPWDRRPVAASVPIDPTVKYPRAYYTELGNDAFLNGLRALFQHTCDTERAALAAMAEWETGATPPEGANAAFVREAYDAALLDITSRIGTASAAAALQLPDPSDKTKIQMVHDRLAEYAVGPSPEPGQLPPEFRLTVDAVFYRFAKYHGKHVQFVFRATPALPTATLPSFFAAPASAPAPAAAAVPVWTLTVAAIRVLGIVYADQIGLFPVTASDPKEPTELDIPQGVLGPNAPYPRTLLDENDTLVLLSKQQQQMRSYLESEGAIKGWATGESLGGAA